MPSLVTDQEIQREIDTLRSLRRRSGSGGPGSLLVDPDLPPATSPTSPSSSSPPRRPRGLSNPRSPNANGIGAYDEPRSPTSPTGGRATLGPPLSRSFSREGDAPIAVVGMAHGKDDEDTGASLHVTGGAMAPSPQDDPTHLFWVPAHLHPELAPGEFRAFLKSHTQPEAEGELGEGAGEASLAFGGGSGLERRLSALNRRSSLGGAHALPASTSGGLGRKRSMLSRQYHPRANDNVEDEPLLPPGAALSRANSRRSSIYGGRTGEQDLTLVDLQRLEELADEAASSGDGDLGKMRNLLRRSLSISATGLPGDEEGLAPVDENDAPIILPPPGQILRRTARTKIRKAHLPGDGGGHRFGPRKNRSALGSPDLGEDDDGRDDGRLSPYGGVEGVERRRVSDRSEEGSDDMHSAESGYTPGERVGLRDERYDQSQRKMSTESNEESAIYDSYGDTSVESSQESSKQDMDDLSHDGHEEVWDEHQQRTPTGDSYEDDARQRVVGDRAKSPEQVFTTPPSSPDTVRREPVAQQVDYRHQTNPYEQLQAQQPLRSPPGVVPPPAQYHPEERTREAIKADIAPPQRSTSPAPSTDSKRDKEKKSGFFSKKDKDSKTKKGDKEKKDKEKDGFLGSLFGSKKKHEEPPLKFSSAGPAAAAALLGSSKSAKSVGLGQPGPTPPAASAINNYARYPIHVERAVYRLSHIKLANPRRPLYEQVLISNLMFWYLSIINRNHNTPTTPTTATMGDKEKASPANGEGKSAGLATAPEPKAARPGPASTPQKAQPPSAVLQSSMQNNAEQPKRGSLSKAQSGPPSRARQAEMPIRQPQYGMQLQMEKEYQRQGPHVSAPPPPQPQQQHRPTQNGPPTLLAPPMQQQQPQSHQRAQSQPPQPQMMHQQGPREKPRSASSSVSSRDVPPPLIIPAQQDPRRPHSPHEPRSPVSEIRRSSGERMNLSGALEPPRAGRQGPSPPPMDRRDVRPGPPRQGHAQAGGIQPGQVFQYPSGMVNVQPGQVFPPQVGQVFHHPQYNPAPNPAAHHGGPGGHPSSSRPGPPPQPQRNLPWADGGPAQLPPGAMPPRSMSVSQDQQQWGRLPAPGPARPYDGAPNGYSGPPPGDPRQRQQLPPQQQQQRPGPPHYPQQYSQQPPHAGQSQPYNPYGRPPDMAQGQRGPAGHPQMAPGMLYDGPRR